MCAGIGDVAAHGAADDGGDGREIDRIGQEGLAEGVTHRRCRNERHIERQHDHHEAGEDNEPVDCQPCTLGNEDGDGEYRADGAADFRVQPENGIETKAGAADIADVEEQATDDDEDGQEITGAGNGGIGDIGCAHTRQRHNAPDVELDDEVEWDGGKNAESEGRAQLRGECRRLRDEARTDGGCRHQEDRSQKRCAF